MDDSGGCHSRAVFTPLLQFARLKGYGLGCENEDNGVGVCRRKETEAQDQ